MQNLLNDLAALLSKDDRLVVEGKLLKNKVIELPFLALGLTFVTTGTIWCFILAIMSSMISDDMRRNWQLAVVMQKLYRGIFVLLGVKLAFSMR